MGNGAQSGHCPCLLPPQNPTFLQYVRAFSKRDDQFSRGTARNPPPPPSIETVSNTRTTAPDLLLLLASIFYPRIFWVARDIGTDRT